MDISCYLKLIKFTRAQVKLTWAQALVGPGVDTPLTPMCIYKAGNMRAYSPQVATEYIFVLYIYTTKIPRLEYFKQKCEIFIRILK